MEIIEKEKCLRDLFMLYKTYKKNEIHSIQDM